MFLNLLYEVKKIIGGRRDFESTPRHVSAFVRPRGLLNSVRHSSPTTLVDHRTARAVSGRCLSRVRLLDHGVGRPELDRSAVLSFVELDAGAALLLAERVAHHRDGRHGALGRLQLRVDADDAPLGVGHVALGLGLSFVFLLELFTRVEDDVQVLRAGRIETLEPAGQDGQLGRSPCLVA